MSQSRKIIHEVTLLLSQLLLEIWIIQIFRDFCHLAIILIVFAASLNDKVDALSCEEVKACYLSQRCCHLNGNVRIDSADSTLSPKDEHVTTILLAQNKRIHHLPVALGNSYPNLKFYDAGHCGVREISRRNFEELEFLVWLDLRQNQIETLRSSTFKDLSALETLILSKFF